MLEAVNRRDLKRLLLIRKTKLYKQINDTYDSIKDSKNFNDYYFALHDLLKKFFVQEYLYSYGKLPYPDFDEEMVEDFFLNWSRQHFSLRARERKKKPYKTLADKISGDEIKRANYYLNIVKSRKELVMFDLVHTQFNNDYYCLLNKLENPIDKDSYFNEVVDYEFNRLKDKFYFKEDETKFNISLFISLFLSSFDIDYITSNLFYSLTKDDFLINSLKCETRDVITRIERRIDG